MPVCHGLPAFAKASIIGFKDCSIIMAIKMNDAVPRTLDSRGAGPAKDSCLAGISEVRRDREFDGIDWSAAAPGWGSMFTGLFLPFLALALLIVSIDLALCWSFERWVDASSSVSPLVLAAMMFPLPLISAFCCCKLFLYLKDAMRMAARSGKRQSPV